MAEENKALVKSSIALARFDPKARKELVIRGLIALAEGKDEKQIRKLKGGKLLSGTAASSGIALGFVRNIGKQDPQLIAKTIPGEVIVAIGPRVMSLPYPPEKYSDYREKYMDFLKKASAFVIDVGGYACNAAVIARAVLGIPAVTGTVNGTTLLRTGQKVIVDGTEGAVYLVNSPEVCPDCLKKYGITRYLQVMRSPKGVFLACPGWGDQEHPCRWPFKKSKEFR